MRVWQTELELWYVHNSAGCRDRGCQLKIGADPLTFTFYVQHGPNPESRRTFGAGKDPFYFQLDMTVWANAIHQYEDAQHDLHELADLGFQLFGTT